MWAAFLVALALAAIVLVIFGVLLVREVFPQRLLALQSHQR